MTVLLWKQVPSRFSNFIVLPTSEFSHLLPLWVVHLSKHYLACLKPAQYQKWSNFVVLYRLKPRLYSRLRAQFFPIRFDPWVGQLIVTLLSFRMWLYFVAFDSLYNALLIVISSVQALWTLKLWRWLPHKYSRIQSFHKNKRMACSSTDRFCDVSE